MADLTPQGRLQPALLDRLVDAVPANRTKEPRDQRVLNKARMRQAVLRDLAWLFNATRPAARDGLGGYRHTERSVLNFGLPPFSGVTASSLDIIALEQAIRQTILDFEPRIIASSSALAKGSA